jgi:hypothetical protein
LITEAGRSTTSPAAIWLASRGLSSSMRRRSAPRSFFGRQFGARNGQVLADFQLIALQVVGAAQVAGDTW